jgi:hypothetical protein
MDGFHQVVKVPGELNPDPRGTESHGPKGGLQHQDDLDTNKKDVASDEAGDGASHFGPVTKTDENGSNDNNDR